MLGFKLNTGVFGLGFKLIQVGIRDQLQAASDQRVVNPALLFELRFLLVLIGKRELHLLKANVVELGRVGVASR